MNKTAGERIRYVRSQKGWTQERLYQETGISKSFLSEVENSRSDISGANLLKIANALGTTLDYLMKGDTREKFSESNSVEIPKALAKLAEEEGLSYIHVMSLLEADYSLKARRSSRETKEFTKEEWRNFYNKLKDFLK